ncbi:MAG: S9 family peptidase [Deltaproteobacteria bacterium]|nr:S9 family peptidase [Deltaproteobacteria bacterium]
MFGETLVDQHPWLRERESEEVQAHLQAENAHTAQTCASQEGLRKALYAEILGRIQEDDRSVPARDGPYLYSWRTEAGRPHTVYCRRRDVADAPEEVVLDVNLLAEGEEYTALGAYEVSPDHKTLAWSVDHDGDERFVLRFRDLETGVEHPEAIEDTSDDVAWFSDGRTLLYVVLDEQSRPHQVRRHVVGTDPAEDVVVYGEADDAFFVGVSRTRDGALLLIQADSAVTSECRWLPADVPEAAPTVIWPRAHEVEYFVDHRAGQLYLHTNRGAPLFQLLRVPLEAPQGPAEVLVPERPGITLEGIELFAHHLVWWDRQDGLTKVRVRSLETGAEHELEFADPIYEVWAVGNLEMDTRALRLAYCSLVVPATTFEYHLDDRTRTTLRVAPVPGYDPARYVSERLWATAPDGVEVPISVVRHVDTPIDGNAPCVIYGYGAYGEPYEAHFSRHRVSLLDRGLVVAIAHVRGGGDLGRPWKEAGRLGAKMNSFTDLIACAEHLVAQRYAAPDRLACSGGSAGGLLVAAALNLRPELFRVTVAQVPFVDVLQSLLDPSLPLTVVEWDEWGDPRAEAAFRNIRAWSPCDNVRPAPYPDVLITAGFNDPRVQYWEPAKWALLLRAANTRPDAQTLLKVDLGAGHGGQSGRYGEIEDSAFELAFLLDRLGVG